MGVINNSNEKMLLEIALILPLDVVTFIGYLLFWSAINIVSDVESLLNKNAFFGNVVDTPNNSKNVRIPIECNKSK